ncbi:MAG: adenylate/guanylate cyclase domain-containing protein, partial [Spirochaetales bacterium]|nr:adenylate/guanylate cyclase domain-containing protein [Spirochaetales bacterium]
PFVLHGLEVFYASVVIAWYTIPFVFPDVLRINPHKLVFLLFELRGGEMVVSILSFCVIYLLPVICLLKLISALLHSKLPVLCDPERFIPVLLNIVLSFCIIFFIVIYVIRYAADILFFLTLSPVIYVLIGLSVIYNILFLVVLVVYFKKKNPTFQEYIAFKEKIREGKLLKVEVRLGIQKKLLLSFVSLICILIIILSSILLLNFNKTVLSRMIHNGRTQAEGCATVVQTLMPQDIEIRDYFGKQQRKNIESDFRFISMSYYDRMKNANDFVVTASTDSSLIGNRIKDTYRNTKEAMYAYSKKERSYEFVAPVAWGAFIIGYTVVVYDRDVIFEPYFRTQVKAILISFFFVYISIILVYFFGSRIVHPILFLRMSVNKLSDTLSNMMQGKVKVSANLLRYDDVVRTKDEIKTLSSEFKDMTGVIRGMIPYISTSTFQHAENESPTSRLRKMTFLFTDIRGFTTMCEGLPPAKVVSILNHYLDIQSSIILHNHGDIDKFVGDEIMATFDGPFKEKNACKAGMDIRAAMAKEREKRLKENKKVISIGIGINTGPVVFGSVGAKERMDFTSIGDTVNLAARLEGANKEYHTKSLISEDVYTKVKEDFLCREIDLITVQGKNKPVRIFELLQEKRLVIRKIRELKRNFESGLEKYRKKDWDEALKIFTFLDTRYNDETSGIFIERIRLYRRNPPPTRWNGVFHLKAK